jgi:hypothetical protein
MSLISTISQTGRAITGAVETTKSSGRSLLQTVPTDKGMVWVKRSYSLPPGEEIVLGELAKRWADRLPGIVASWSGAVAMESLPGDELSEAHPEDDWITAAIGLAELMAGERKHVNHWLALGVRDRRPARWKTSLELLRDSDTVRAMNPRWLDHLDELMPDFISRYEEFFTHSATLVPQDSGCCNIHVSESGPVYFDWADVVVGHPVFSCDRLLDQVPRQGQDQIIEAFLAPLDMTRETFNGMRKSNVLHEVLRYHDELEYLAPEDPMYKHLASAVQSQLQVLIEHELKVAQ